LCDTGHRFDVAREGYVNLLPVQQKNSRQPGDDKAMLQARRQILGAGFYEPLLHAIQHQLQQLPQLEQATRGLDIGCGEGYYTGQLPQQIGDSSCAWFGCDIAKHGIKMAAKRYPQVQWAVASSYKLPYQDASFDWITRIYAPSTDAELLRCLKPNGRVLTVTPAPRHLWELKQLIYREAREHSAAIIPIAGLTHQARERISMEQEITAEYLPSLLQMTPLAWQHQAQQRIERDKALTLSFDFYLDRYARADSIA